MYYLDWDVYLCSARLFASVVWRLGSVCPCGESLDVFMNFCTLQNTSYFCFGQLCFQRTCWSFRNFLTATECLWGQTTRIHKTQAVQPRKDSLRLSLCLKHQLASTQPSTSQHLTTAGGPAMLTEIWERHYHCYRMNALFMITDAILLFLWFLWLFNYI